MRIGPVLLLGTGLLAAVDAPSARGQGTPASAAARDEVAARLESVVSALLKSGDVPGLSMAIVRDGRIVLQRSFGVKDVKTGAPVDDETVFEAASLTKPVFSYMVLKLVDAGRLDLDAPLAKYLPGDYIDDPRAAQVTARRVLSHTTGLPNWRPEGQPLELAFTPGERFSYSGEGFGYLQKAVEHLTGETTDALMRKLVFGPLGMKSSAISWEERFEGRKATGHDAGGSPMKARRPAEAHAAATLHTTSGDYARFLIAVLDGTGLSKTSAAEMVRPQVHVDEGCQNCITGKSTGRLSKEIAWGLGVGLEETESGTSVWHWGDNGSSGFHCIVVGDTREKTGVVAFTNGLGGHGILPDVVAAAIGGRHPAFRWLDYERHDSPARVLYRDILARGEPAVAAYAERRSTDPKAALTETQVNRVGYWLLGKKKTREAIAVFERNARDFPKSWNVHDSLAEAYAADGQKDRAIASYQRSLALNPSNTNGAEALRKLKGTPSS